MIPYLLVFLISLLFISFGLTNDDKTKGNLFVGLGLLLPCLLAGLRSLSVGTDTHGYVFHLFKLSTSTNSLFSYFKLAYSWYLQKDYLYLIISFLVGRSGLSFNFLLFIYELLMVFPLYYSFKKLKFNRFSIIVGFVIFYTLMFNLTLNMLRQSIAISFSILSFANFITFKRNNSKKDKYLSYIFLAIAYGFHSTSLVVIPMIMIYSIYVNEKYSEKSKMLLSIILLFISFFTVIFYENILLFIGESGIYPLALYYLQHYSIKDFSYYQLFVNVLIIALLVTNKSKITKSNNSYMFLITFSIINLLISSGLGYFIQYSQRITWYIQYILLFCFVPEFFVSKNDKKTFMFYSMILFITWLLYFVLMNVNETIPYIPYFID